MLRSLIPDKIPAPGPGTLPTTRFQVNEGDTVAVELRTLDGRIVRVSLSRREFAQLLAAGTLQVMLPAGVANADEAERVAGALQQPRRVDPHVLEYFRRLLNEHFTADRMLGPRRLLGPVLAQIQVLKGLRRHAPPHANGQLLKLLAQYAEFAGWLYQDIGDTAAATYWSDRATECAQAAGDYQMVAYMLVRKSNIALLNEEATSVVELAAAVQVPGPTSPKLVALARQQEARGWALLGDADKFRAGLECAGELLSRHPDAVDENAPVYLRQYNMDTLEEQTASGYRACGHAETAVAILERQIAQTPGHLVRDQGHQLAKLANTVLATANPDPERAVDLGLRCVPTARETGSARIMKELRALDRALTRRWPGLAGTAEFHEALRVRRVPVYGGPRTRRNRERHAASPEAMPSGGHGWFRTSDLPLVRRVLSR